MATAFQNLDYADLKLNPDAPNLKQALSVTDAMNEILKAAAAAQAAGQVSAPVATAPAPVPSTGGFDLSKIIATLPAIMAMIQMISQLFPKAAPAPTPQPVPTPSPTPTPTPGPTPTPTPVPSARRITRWGKVRYHGIQQGTSFLPNPQQKKILSQEEGFVDGMKAVVDGDLHDQFGNEIGPGDWTPDLEAAMWFEDNSPRIRWYGENRDVISINGGSDQHGLMPKLKHNIGSLGKNVDAQTGEVGPVYYPPFFFNDAGQWVPTGIKARDVADDEPHPEFPGALVGPTVPSLRARGQG